MFTHTNVPELREMKTKMVKDRRWYETPRGVWYPSITSVLGAKEKPYLQEWRNSLGPVKADKETAILQRIVEGAADRRLRRDLLRTPDLTYGTAVAMARAYEVD